MFDVLHDKPFIFLHAPKTGGGSLKLVLAENRPDTINKLPLSCFRAIRGTKAWLEQKYKYPKESLLMRAYHKDLSFFKERLLKKKCYERVLKFSVVRNPYERMFSLYKWKSKRFKEVKSDLQDYSQLARKYSNAKYTKAPTCISDDVSFRDFVINHDIFLNKYEKNNVLDYVGLEFDRIIRFENLQEDSSLVLKELGIMSEIPHIHKTPQTNDWRSYYDSETKKIVKMIFSKDIAFFGYNI